MSIDIAAKVLLDSKGPHGERVTTFELVMHRFVMAHLLTHRMIARNGESDRARSVEARVHEAVQNPAFPISWPRNEPGMVGRTELDGDALAYVREMWKEASHYAFSAALLLSSNGNLLHKSVANRIIEPFIWHRVVATATPVGWDNFFRQRISPLAQAEIRVLAERMKAAYDASEPQPLPDHGWHLPYVTGYDPELEKDPYTDTETLKMVSVGRCARVSLLNQGKRNTPRDLDLAHRLLSPIEGEPHWSPFEHVCRPANGRDPYGVGCLPGWRQMRHDKEDAYRMNLMRARRDVVE